MAIVEIDKVIIVEGKTDKDRIKSIIREPVDIICTNGTVGVSKLDELIEYVYDKDVYILVDSDDAGDKLRKTLRKELPHAEHIRIDKTFREVAAAPLYHLASILLGANFDVHNKFLNASSGGI
ncbi:MAG: hypothetical protein K0S34_1713 [Bacillales bacterium]|jgi:toprim domain protein|nr:hypothetical protein [Bacillales bacterium]